MCPDTLRIGTKISIERKDVSRYPENRDKNKHREKRMCPDTLRIGTKISIERKDVSRYCENRDKNQHRKKDSVPIPRESGQKPALKENFPLLILIPQPPPQTNLQTHLTNHPKLESPAPLVHPYKILSCPHFFQS